MAEPKIIQFTDTYMSPIRNVLMWSPDMLHRYIPEGIYINYDADS